MFFVFLLNQIALCFVEQIPRAIKQEGDTNYKPLERIYWPSAAVSLTENIFSGIIESSEGGAIYIGGSNNNNSRVDCIIDNCRFERCQATNGGAIYISYASQNYNFTVSDSIFEGCIATQNGGAIYHSNTQVKKEIFSVFRCTFKSNKANTNGGAIYGDLRDSLTIQGCIFESNEAVSGSSIWMSFGTKNKPKDNEEDTFIISDNTFKFAPSESNKINVYMQNAAEKNVIANVILGGCAFSIESSEYTVFKQLEIANNGLKSVTFDKCNCVEQQDSVISVPDSFKPLNNFQFSCSSLDSCEPSNPDPNPPAVNPTEANPNPPVVDPPAGGDDSYKEHDRIGSPTEKISLINTLFKNIVVSSDGGAIFVGKSGTDYKVNCDINNCRFEGCKATNGGAIYINYASNDYNFTVYKSTFLNCGATKGNGGALYLKNVQESNNKKEYLNVIECTFKSNTAKQQGGAIYGSGRDLLTIQDCTFNNNEAPSGSSIFVKCGYYQPNLNEVDTIIISGCTFEFTPNENNKNNVHIENAKITSKLENGPNVDLYLGGCTFSSTSSLEGMTHLEIIENEGGYKAINFNKCNCIQQGSDTVSVPNTFNIENFHFNCNPSGTCTPGEVITPPPKETPEETPKPGGRLVISESRTVNMTEFIGIDSTTEQGGAIFLKPANCTIINCKFETCKAKTGGAIYITYTGGKKYVCNIKKTSFKDCVALDNGGAIYAHISQDDTHSIYIDDCSFEGNNAKNGGAIYASVRDSLSISHCKFDNNKAKAGSSIWCQAGWDVAGDKENALYFLSNTFSFSPEDGSSNLYFRTYTINLSNPDLINAMLIMSLCSFAAKDSKSDNFKHIFIDEQNGKFKSIVLPACICVDQSESAITLPSEVDSSNIVYQCQSLNSCGADSEGYYVHDQIPDEQESPIDVKDSKFLYHRNDGQYGGSISIHNKKVSCTLNHCKFDSCKAENGGAICLYYTGSENNYTCIITKTIFANCEAVKRGGAIYANITQYSRHSITITECTFTNNKAENGGAVYAGVRDQFTLTDSVFEDNTASVNGSSLWCKLGWNSRYTMNVATIKNNKFTFTPSKSTAKNGPKNVFIFSTTLNADATPNANLIFGGCTFAAKEPKIKPYYHLFIYQHRSQFESITFTSCSCVAQGNETVSLPLKYNPLFNFNFNCQDINKCSPEAEPTPKPTPDQDGYIPLERINRVEFDGKVILTKVKFVKIVAENNLEGGAMYINNVECRLNDCLFDSCSSSEKAGAVRISYSKILGNYTFNALNCIFKNCKSKYGGAIYSTIVQPKRHYITFEKCNFETNKATKLGGAIYGEFRDSFMLLNSVFTNNEAVNGSSIWIQSGAEQGKVGEVGNTATIYGNTFSFTPSETNSINVYIESSKLKEDREPNANVYIGKNQFTTVNSEYQEYKHLFIVENGKFQSIQFSGCNCIQGAESTVSITASEQPNTNSLKFNCQAISECPADEVPQPPESGECSSASGRQESIGQKVSLEKVCFSNLAAPISFDGGAIRVVNAELEAENCRFTACTSESNGGAIYVSFTEGEWELEIENCVFSSCYAGKRGGAIYFINKVPTCESSFEKCRFENNTAVLGAGAFYYSPCANSEMKSCLFINNSCIDPEAQGTSLYAYIENKPEVNEFSKMKRLIKDDDIEVKPVVIEGNKFRSQPVAGTQQMYINLKKTGQLQFNTNAFSFDKAEEVPENANHVVLSKDDGAVFSVKDDICIDSKTEHVYGIYDSSIKIRTECHNADSEFDSPKQGGGDKKKKNVGMIVGIVVAVVVVIVVVVVVVIFVLKRRNSAKYVSDLNNDDIADNSTAAIESTDAPHDL